MNISVLGAGSWGIALAVLLSTKRNHRVCLWEFNPTDAAMLKEKREHLIKLPGVRIPEDIQITNDIAEAVIFANSIICVVPAQTMRATMRSVYTATTHSQRRSIECWIIASKGIEVDTLKLMSTVMCDELGRELEPAIVALSGPSHAEEVSRNIPTTVVAASLNSMQASYVQENFSTDTFRIYTNNDINGVELAGSVKNVIAVAAGISDGLGFGDNTKGAIMTRGIVEMGRLGEKMGANRHTFSGLAGIGDLITTCISRHSRNRNIGELMGSGLSLSEALSRMTMVAEGVETTKSVQALARKFAIEMPITEAVYQTLFQGKTARDAARELMLRDFKSE